LKDYWGFITLPFKVKLAMPEMHHWIYFKIIPEEAWKISPEGAWKISPEGAWKISPEGARE
jgi:hypothetical protein